MKMAKDDIPLSEEATSDDDISMTEGPRPVQELQAGARNLAKQNFHLISLMFVPSESQPPLPHYPPGFPSSAMPLAGSICLPSTHAHSCLPVVHRACIHLPSCVTSFFLLPLGSVQCTEFNPL
jgi:hypothetical protein